MKKVFEIRYPDEVEIGQAHPIGWGKLPTKLLEEPVIGDYLHNTFFIKEDGSVIKSTVVFIIRMEQLEKNEEVLERFLKNNPNYSSFEDNDRILLIDLD